MERTFKRLKSTDGSGSSVYMHTRYLLSTSDICERLYSIAGHTLTNRRRGILHNIFGKQFSCTRIRRIEAIRTSKQQ